MLTRREFVAAGFCPFLWFRHDTGMAGARFRAIRNGEDRRRYIWIHGNETTARDILIEHMKSVDGRAFLVKNTIRYVEIYGGKLDPNRMFSREGAERNLRTLNPGWNDKKIRRALNRLDHDRPGFLRRLLPSVDEALVALHNNSEGYSMEEEIPISDAVSLSDRDHPREFLLCTNRSDFEVLAGGPHNVLLQNRVPKVDDGSLSRLCAARGLRYINIEASLGNAAAQRRMLEWIENVLT